jgi:ribose 5-phosphate isomerase B
MRIAFGADDDNECVRAVLDHLRAVADVTVHSHGRTWPDFAQSVGSAVATGDADFGVVMCWTGTGTTIAANKVVGVRAALAWEPWIARGARLWNDANVLGLSLKRTAPDIAVECVRAFLETPEFDVDEAANIEALRPL